MKKIIIIPEHGGFTGWLASDQGRKVRVISPTDSRDSVLAQWQALKADPAYIDRLEADTGLTFINQ